MVKAVAPLLIIRAQQCSVTQGIDSSREFDKLHSSTTILSSIWTLLLTETARSEKGKPQAL
jgi:hypothetical protein